MSEAFASRSALRRANAEPKRGALGDLKSDLKKATTFARRFKTFTSDQEKLILTELQTLNVKMFVTEAAQGVGQCIFDAASKFKGNDAPSLAIVCSAFHQRYEDFIPEVLSSIRKGFDLKPVLEEMEAKLDPSIAPVDASRLRLAIRVMCEFWLCGLVTDTKFILGILQKLCSTLESDASSTATAAKKVPPHVTVNVLTIANLIARTVGIEIMGSRAGCDGLLPFPGPGAVTLQFANEAMEPIDPTIVEQQKQATERRRGDALCQQNCYCKDQERLLFSRFLATIADHSVSLVEKLKKTVEQRWRTMCEQAELRGDPSAEVKEQFSLARREAERLYVMVENFTRMIGRDGKLPPPIDLTVALQKSNVDAALTFTSGMAEFFTVRVAETMNYFDDEEQRSFYEDVPAVGSNYITEELKTAPLSAQAKLQQQEEEGELLEIDGMTRGFQSLPARDRQSHEYANLEQLLVELHRCTSARTVDEWAERFFQESTKYFAEGCNHHRAQAYLQNFKKALQVELRFEPDRAHEMIPFLARAAAIASKTFPDVGETLSKQLENSIQRCVRESRQQVFLSKSMNTRYLCEVTKFRLSSPIRIIRVMFLLLETWSVQDSQQLLLICLEHVATFFLRGGMTRQKMEDILERTKENLVKVGAANTGIESRFADAFAQIRLMMNPNRPQQRNASRSRSPLEQYVAFLLQKKLSDDKNDFDFVLDKFWRIPWSDGEAAHICIKLLRKAHKVAFDKVHLVVEIIHDIAQVHGWVAASIIECVLEDLREDLEIPLINRSQQKRLQDYKFLAELYNFGLAPFRVLEMVMLELMLYYPQCSTRRSGVALPAAAVDCRTPGVIWKLPANDFSRVRAMCSILSAAAPYVLRGMKEGVLQSTRLVLALFNVHVQSRQKPLPMELDYRIAEMLSQLNGIAHKKRRHSNRDDPQKGRHRRRVAARHDAASADDAVEFTFEPTLAQAVVRLNRILSEPPMHGNSHTFNFVKSFESQEPGLLIPVIASNATSNRLAAMESDAVEQHKNGPLSAPVESKNRFTKDGDGNDSSSSESSSDSDSSSSSDSDSDSGFSDEEALEDRGGGDTAHRLGPLAAIDRRRGAMRSAEDAEFDALLSETVKESSADAVRKHQGKQQSINTKIEQRLAVGAVAGAQKGKTPSTAAAKAPSAGTVQFTMLRRSQQGKAESTPLYFPEDSDFVQRSTANVAKYQSEQQMVQQKTLEITRQQLREETELLHKSKGRNR